MNHSTGKTVYRSSEARKMLYAMSDELDSIWLEKFRTMHPAKILGFAFQGLAFSLERGENVLKSEFSVHFSKDRYFWSHMIGKLMTSAMSIPQHETCARLPRDVIKPLDHSSALVFDADQVIIDRRGFLIGNHNRQIFEIVHEHFEEMIIWSRRYNEPPLGAQTILYTQAIAQ